MNMKYDLEITIDLPRDKVVALFDNPGNMKDWQDGFISLEHLEGEPGTTGATSKLLYQMGKRKIEMIETIVSRNLPEEFSATYDAKGVDNLVQNYFSVNADGGTLYKTVQEFKFSGFMKLIGWLMPGVFKKQSYKYMEDFKTFAEQSKN